MVTIDIRAVLQNSYFLSGFTLGYLCGIIAMFIFRDKNYKRMSEELDKTIERKNAEIDRLNREITKMAINNSAQLYKPPKN